MKTIWKFEVEIDRFTVAIPKDAQVLSVQSQHDTPCMWVLLNPDEPTVSRKFVVFGTGLPIHLQSLKYAGTFQLHDGDFIGHLFEETDFQE